MGSSTAKLPKPRRTIVSPSQFLDNPSLAGMEIARFVRQIVSGALLSQIEVPSRRFCTKSFAMTSDYLFVGVGALVWLFGIVLVAWHVRQRRKTMGDPGLPPDEQRFLDQQYRRRMQTSALTITLGALIALCDYLTFLKTSPGYAATYVTVLLLLAMWLVLLAVGDAMASRIHMGRSLRRNRKSREALAGALAELRRHEEQELRRRDDDLMSASNDRK